MAKITRRELFHELNKISAETNVNQHLLRYVENKLQIDFSDASCGSARADVLKCISRFTSKIAFLKRKQRKGTEDFIVSNQDWLDQRFSLPSSAMLFSAKENIPPKKNGRPQKDFGTSSNRTKRRKCENLIQNNSADQLGYATQMAMRAENRRASANLIGQAVSSNDEANKIINAVKSTKKTLQPYTVDEALSLIVDLKLTVDQYKVLRLGAKERGADLYPSYDSILEAKEKCYPVKESMSVSEHSAEITLQALLDHTAERLIMLQEPVISTLQPALLEDLILITKWGCDGSSGQARYKQRLIDFKHVSALEETSNSCEDESIDRMDYNDNDLFMISLVPLILTTASESGKVIVWKNGTPSSPRYCRPVSMQQKKETTDLIVRENERIETQINALRPTHITCGTKNVIIRHNLQFTMIDGKVCNAITGTSSQVCYICGAKPSEMNDINRVLQKPVIEKNFQFGLSSLHAWIRMFECLLHLSYKLEIKKWQARSKEEKKIVLQRKTAIQRSFRTRIGLLVDFPKQGGGTTNDGNTARRFFSDPGSSSDITGIDIILIERFAVILKTLACGFAIDTQAFGLYALETAKLYVQLYSWYYMPASVHKILLHGSDIVRKAIIPIGQLSEEAQESRNKDYKYYREHHTRKFSRVATNEDLFRRLLLSSDPIISSLRSKFRCKTNLNLPDKVVRLLSNPQLE